MIYKNVRYKTDGSRHNKYYIMFYTWVTFKINVLHVYNNIIYTNELTKFVVFFFSVIHIFC